MIVVIVRYDDDGMGGDGTIAVAVDTPVGSEDETGYHKEDNGNRYPWQGLHPCHWCQNDFQCCGRVLQWKLKDEIQFTMYRDRKLWISSNAETFYVTSSQFDLEIVSQIIYLLEVFNTVLSKIRLKQENHLRCFQSKVLRNTLPHQQKITSSVESRNVISFRYSILDGRVKEKNKIISRPGNQEKSLCLSR
jgi:hypothetical protein